MDSESRHKISDKVILNFFGCGKLMFGEVSGVKYTNYGKVLYDISLQPFKREDSPDKDYKTTLKDIDSFFVEKLQEKHECN